MFANAIFRPTPDWEISTPAELAVWGTSISLAIVLGGVVLRGWTSGMPSRRPRVFVALIVGCALCGIVAVLAATRGPVRQANERIAKLKQEKESSADPRP